MIWVRRIKVQQNSLNPCVQCDSGKESVCWGKRFLVKKLTVRLCTVNQQGWGTKHLSLYLNIFVNVCERTRLYLLLHIHVHQSRDWFQEMFYYLFSSKAANHNHSLSSLHPPLSTPPISFSLSPSLLHTPLFPSPSCVQGYLSLGKVRWKKRKNLERENERERKE